MTKTVTYEYDVNNRRVSKTVDGTTTEHYVWDNDHHTLTLDDSGDAQQINLYGDAVDLLFATETDSGDVFWSLADNQNTVRDVVQYDDVNDETDVVVHRKYDIWGNLISETNPQTGPVPENIPAGYTGREWDADAELYYYRARWYDPVVGRFVSEDPIGFEAGDANVQRYVGNQVPNATDPSGLSQEDLERVLELLNNGSRNPGVEVLKEDDGTYVTAATHSINLHKRLRRRPYYCQNPRAVAEMHFDWELKGTIRTAHATGKPWTARWDPVFVFPRMTSLSWVLESAVDESTERHEYLHLKMAELWGRYITNEIRAQARSGNLRGYGPTEDAAEKDLVAKTTKIFTPIARKLLRLQDHAGNNWQLDWERQMLTFIDIDERNDDETCPGVDLEYTPPRPPRPFGGRDKVLSDYEPPKFQIFNIK